MKMIKKSDLYNDKIGFVESWDFSEANTSKEARIDAITKVASVCYGKEAKNKIALFNMLESESIGLPSSAFEFVPILIDKYKYELMWSDVDDMNMPYEMFCFEMEKYGQWIETEQSVYLLTNLRACLNDNRKYSITKNTIDFINYFNTSPEEIQIIKDNFKVFFSKIPLFVRSQMVRHRASFQELSRRYTDNARSPIEFYVKGGEGQLHLMYESTLNYYATLLANEMKPEDARAVLPQATYTKIWSAFLPDSYDNFIKLRTKKNAQSEIRELVLRVKDLIGSEK